MPRPKTLAYPMTMHVQSNEEMISARDAKRDEAIAVLGSDVQRVKSDLNLLATNHLPHLQGDLKNLDRKVDENQEKIMVKFAAIDVKLARWVGGGIALLGLLDLIPRLLPLLDK